MSVAVSVELPDQPGSGITNVQPLGGNGWNAPISQTYCEVQSVGDGTGGVNQVTVTFDTDHLSMVSWLGVRETGQAADSQAFVNMVFQRGVDMNQFEVLPLTYAAGTDGGDGAYGVWRPIPMIAPPKPLAKAPRITVNVANVNGESLYVHLMVLEFNPNAAQVTPMGFLVGNFAS